MEGKDDEDEDGNLVPLDTVVCPTLEIVAFGVCLLAEIEPLK